MKKITLILFLFAGSYLFAQNQLLSAVEQYYDSSTSSYTNSSGYDYAYDSNNNLISEIYYYWDTPSNSFVPSYKQEWTYNSNNKTTSIIYSNYDNQNSQYLINDREILSYNAQGELIEILDQNYNGSQYVDDARSTFTYQNGTPNGFIYEEWNGSQWAPEERATVNYNTNGTINNAVYEEITNGVFGIYGRETYQNNSSGLITTATYDIYDGTNYTADQRIDYVLDSNGNRLSETESYNPVSTPNFKEEFTYDTSILMSALANPFKDKTGIDYVGYNNPHVNKVLTKIQSNYDDTSMTFQISSRTIYNYNSTLSADKEVQLVEFKIFPNPTTSIINVASQETSLSQIDMYDVLGKKVFTTTQTTFNISTLHDGLYIMNLTDENGSVTSQKIVKN
ncbi:MAG: T9SS type A sorting domain-containing protein [Nonlabens sp.]|uniref:T9SS type A sorting domain-containing protein n=1 Tax=Nonlabens sp. TaxID=1888209 RepID=UPI003EF1F4A1